jgi:hypothetical protein
MPANVGKPQAWRKNKLENIPENSSASIYHPFMCKWRAERDWERTIVCASRVGLLACCLSAIVPFLFVLVAEGIVSGLRSREKGLKADGSNRTASDTLFGSLQT